MFTLDGIESFVFSLSRLGRPGSGVMVENFTTTFFSLCQWIDDNKRFSPNNIFFLSSMIKITISNESNDNKLVTKNCILWL